MKQLVLLILALTFLTGLLFADDFIIGNGTSDEYYVPFNGSYDYSWSKFCFSQAEVAGSGMTNGAQITKLSLYVDNAISGYVTDNQTIYIGAFYNSVYGSADTAFPNTSSYTQVFNGSITWNGPGWVEIPLSQSYTWNSSWGLEILWENRDGTRLSPYPKFRYPNVSNTSVHKYANTSYPSLTNGTKSARRPNIWFITPATDVPGIGSAVNPADLALDVNINTKLDWHHTGGDPTGYRLWFGTDNPPSNIVSNLVTTESSYTPVSYL